MRFATLMALSLLLIVLLVTSPQSAQATVSPQVVAEKTVKFKIGGQGEFITELDPDAINKTVRVGQNLTAVSTPDYNNLEYEAGYDYLVKSDFIRAEFNHKNLPLVEREPFGYYNDSISFDEETGAFFTDYKAYNYKLSGGFYEASGTLSDVPASEGVGDNYSRALGWTSISYAGTSDLAYLDIRGDMDYSDGFGRIEANFVYDEYYITESGTEYRGSSTWTRFDIDTSQLWISFDSVRMRIVFRINWTAIAEPGVVALWMHFKPAGLSVVLNAWKLEYYWLSEAYKIAEFYRNGTVKWLIDPTSKYFNVTVTDGFYVLDIETIGLLGSDHPWLKKIRLYNYIDLKGCFGEHFAIGFLFGFKNINTTIANAYPLLVDGFQILLSGKSVGFFTPYGADYGDYAFPLLPVGANLSYDGATAYLRIFEDAVFSVLPYVMYHIWPDGISLYVLKNRTGEILPYFQDALKHTSLRFLRSITIRMHYKVSGVVAKSAEPKVTHYESKYTESSDFGLVLKGLEVPSGTYEVVIYDDRMRSVHMPVGNNVYYESKQKREFNVTVKVFSRVALTVKIVDVRGQTVDYGVVKLEHEETCRQFSIVVKDGYGEAEVESGTYAGKVIVLLYEQAISVDVGVEGGYLVVKLNVDMRQLTGEAIRALLVYIPVALVIPIVLLLPSIPLLVRKKK